VTPEDLRWMKVMTFGSAVMLTLFLLAIEPTDKPGSSANVSDNLGCLFATGMWVWWYSLATQEKK